MQSSSEKRTLPKRHKKPVIGRNVEHLVRKDLKTSREKFREVLDKRLFKVEEAAQYSGLKVDKGLQEIWDEEDSFS